MRELLLCYHAVSDTWRHPLAVGEAAFERQMRSLLRRGYAGSLHVTFDDAYASVPRAVDVLGRLGVQATVFVVTACAERGDPPVDHAADPAARTLTWDELRDLGVEVGSHTVTHPHLTQLDDAEVDRELTESRTQIEDELRRPCRSLAYPYGDADDRVRRAAERAGYETAYTARLGRSRPFGVPRVSVFRHDGAVRFWLKTSLFVRP